MNLKR